MTIPAARPQTAPMPLPIMANPSAHDSVATVETAEAQDGPGGASTAAVNDAADAARVHLRRLEMHTHPAFPAGLETHADGMWHQVQKGDSFWGIAREYSQAYHLDISAQQLQQANPGVTTLHPGQLLRVPYIEERSDAMAQGASPHLKQQGAELRHVVQKGQTLSGIAREYSESWNLKLDYKDVYNINKDVVGSNPNLIKPGQALRIPGITTSSPADTYRSISEMNGDRVASRTSRVKHENGTVSTFDIFEYRLDGDRAERIGTSPDDAIRAAKELVRSGNSRTGIVGVVHASDGKYWIAPLNGREIPDNMDDSDRTLSLAYRNDDREVVALVAQHHDGLHVRRYDA